jgi:type IV pilus assembly protein PilE
MSSPLAHRARHAIRIPIRRQRARGFTLIELMVAVVVAAILAALAYPAFLDSVRKSRRSEAFAALVALQQAQERWRAGNASYTADLAALGIPASTATGHYTLRVLSASTSGYLLSAQAQGPQAKDESCVTMALGAAGGTISYGSACGTCALSTPLADSSRCWSRQ